MFSPVQYTLNFLSAQVQGKIWYLVRWKATWEREDQLIGCETLIQIYEDSQNNELYGYAVNKVHDWLMIIF